MHSTEYHGSLSMPNVSTYVENNCKLACAAIYKRNTCSLLN